MTRLACSLAALILWAGCPATTGTPNTPASPAGDGVAQGAPATDFTLRDLEGRDVRLSDYTGKVVLIDFWATWCVPCEAEIPHLQQLYDEHKEKGFVILGIAMDGPETLANVGPKARSLNITFPVLLDEETKVVAVYNPKRTAPLSILIDRKGQIARTRSGFNAGDEKAIEADVKSLLGP
ncbi:MAG: TlpA family protein disulfide reductase [Myxococcales bacterium]|nr:TlpA family protein disulfide reductase [Myxococcales bacterium]